MEQQWSLRGYAVETLLGTGATAEVWQARVLATGEPVALKRVAVDGTDRRRRAQTEAALLTALDHPNLVRLHALVPTHDALVLVLDLAARGSLRDLLRARGRLTPGEAVSALAPTAAAVAYLHSRSIVHGDVSAANVLFTAGGEPLLADVGVARITGDTRDAESTPLYVDPAVAGGAVPGPPSDVFMLGAVAFHVLTGAPLWRGDTPLATLASAVSGVPLDVGQRLRAAGVGAPTAEVVLRALATDPQRRCTAVEFALDLRQSVAPVAIDFDAGRGRSTSPPDPDTEITVTSEAGSYPPAAPPGGPRRADRPSDPAPAAAGARQPGDAPVEPPPASVSPGRPTFERPVRSAPPAAVPDPGGSGAQRLPATPTSVPPVAPAGAVGAPDLGVGPPRPRPTIPRPRRRRFGRDAGPRRPAAHARSGRADGSRVSVLQRRGVLAVPAALLVATCALVLAHGSAARRAAAPAGPHTSPGSSRPPSGWVQVLANLDAVRAQAYATRRPQLLSHVYVPGALLRHDTAQLVALVPTGCGLTGALTRYRSTATVRQGTHTVLIVDADLPATTLVCAGAVRASAPGRAARLRVELVDTAAGPRIASQSSA